MQKREMTEHYYAGGADAIDGWRCSNCRWSYDTGHPVGKYDVPYDIRQRAKEKFAEHICSEHPK